MPLTVKQIEAATFGKSRERLGDGSGLFLRLYPSGSKIFQVLLPAEAGSKRRVWVSVGDFPATTLREAREMTFWARTQSARGWGAEMIRSAVRSEENRPDLPGPGGPEVTSPKAPAARQGRGRPKGHAVAAPKRTFADVARLWFEQKRQGLSNGSLPCAYACARCYRQLRHGRKGEYPRAFLQNPESWDFHRGLLVIHPF